MNKIIKKWAHYILLLLTFSIPKYQGTHAMEETENQENEYFLWMQTIVKKKTDRDRETCLYQFFVSSQVIQRIVYDRIVQCLKEEDVNRDGDDIMYTRVYSLLDDLNKKAPIINLDTFKNSDDKIEEIRKNLDRPKCIPVIFKKVKLLTTNPIKAFQKLDYSRFNVINSENELKPFYTLLSKEDLSNTFVLFSFVNKEDPAPVSIFASPESDPFHLMKVLSHNIGIEIQAYNNPNFKNDLKKEINMKIDSFSVEYPSGINKAPCVMKNLDIFFKEAKETDIKIQDILTTECSEYNSGANYNLKEVFNMIMDENKDYTNDNTIIISKSFTLKKDEFIAVFNTEKNKSQNEKRLGSTTRKIGIISGTIMISIAIIGPLLYYVKQSKMVSGSTQNRKYDDKE